jgi:hypothetical protein
MSINYTVGDIEDFQITPEGRFPSVIDFVESKMYGKEEPFEAIEVRFIIEDDNLYGRRHVESYMIGHPNELAQRIAKSKLNKLAHEIGGLKKGDAFKEDCLLYKKVFITIKHEASKKDGNIYARLVAHELVDNNNLVSHETQKEEPQSGVVLPMATTLNNIALNDEVPF